MSRTERSETWTRLGAESRLGCVKWEGQAGPPGAGIVELCFLPGDHVKPEAQGKMCFPIDNLSVGNMRIGRVRTGSAKKASS